VTFELKPLATEASGLILHVSLVILASSSNGPAVPLPLKSKLAELLEMNFITSTIVYTSNVVWVVLNKATSMMK
jgi:hypothetical protein